MTSYSQIPTTEMPADVRFDVPRSVAGQMIEIAYGARAGASEHGPGDEYRRITDRSTREVTYLQRTDLVLAQRRTELRRGWQEEASRQLAEHLSTTVVSIDDESLIEAGSLSGAYDLGRRMLLQHRVTTGATIR